MALETQYIEYTHQGDLLEGFCAFDPQHGQKQPLVLVAHAWGGRDTFACDKARELAALGYVGFALDMFGKGVLGQSKTENSALIAPFMDDRQHLCDRLLAALQTAQALPMVNPEKTAAIGYCFGGLCVLDLARHNGPVNGVISFHGLLQAPGALNTAKHIKPSVLVLHGYDDPMATPDHLITFCEEMTEKQADWQLHAYGNTTHAFTNPQANDPDFGTLYNATADARSSIAMRTFLNTLFSEECS